MINLPAGARVLLATRAVDFRKGAYGLAALASEYPDKMQELWERAPEYANKGTQVMNMVSTFLERLSEHRALRAESPYVV